MQGQCRPEICETGIGTNRKDCAEQQKKFFRDGHMDSALNSLMLVCAVVAALAAGVLLGYVACKGLFGLFTAHARSISAARASAKTEAQVVNA